MTDFVATGLHNMDDVVLSYHDSLLRKSDIQLLEKGNWLNDKIIAFMFEYFQQELFSNENVLFLDPDFVQLIKLSQSDEALALLSTVDLSSQSLIFIPINNNQSTQQAGGTHWSLIVYDGRSKKFNNYDSAANCNMSQAKEVAEIFGKALDVTTHDFEDRSYAEQTNSYDCGVYVIKTAETLCSAMKRNQPCDFLSVTPDVITEERKRINRLIALKAAKS